jgi:nucleotide-binding universal stress UspA family protein
MKESVVKPFKKILVPVDFSADAHRAILTATDLARRYDGALTLLHVFQPMTLLVPDGYIFFTPSQMAEVISNCSELLSRLQAEALAAGAPRVATEQLQGVAAAEISAYASQHDFDLIVMGTHGRTGIAHAVLGSVAERVVRAAPCPVLTVREPKPPGTGATVKARP